MSEQIPLPDSPSATLLQKEDEAGMLRGSGKPECASQLSLTGCVALRKSLHLPELSISVKWGHLTSCTAFSSHLDSRVSPPSVEWECPINRLIAFKSPGLGEPQFSHL